MQFTCGAITGVLKREGVKISMDGRGRTLDNIFVERLRRTVKHEEIYLKGYADMGAMMGLTKYFAYYNEERSHQSPVYRTPSVVYHSAENGGARIVDRFSGEGAGSTGSDDLGQRDSAAGMAESRA